MNPVARFESFIERLMERTFTRAARSHLQPVEIEKRISRVMDAEQSVGAEGILVPNVYDVYLSSDDFAHYEPASRSMGQRMEAHVARVMRQRRYSTLSRPVVTLHEDPRLRDGQVRVEGHLEDLIEQTPAPQHTAILPQVDVPYAEPTPEPPAIEFEGQRYAVLRSPTRIGRMPDNDIVVNDRRVSRQHAELILRGKEWRVRDLGSTNGTALNGRAIKESPLKSGDTISLGGVEARWAQ